MAKYQLGQRTGIPCNKGRHGISVDFQVNYSVFQFVQAQVADCSSLETQNSHFLSTPATVPCLQTPPFFVFLSSQQWTQQRNQTYPDQLHGRDGAPWLYEKLRKLPILVAQLPGPRHLAPSFTDLLDYRHLIARQRKPSDLEWNI
jgi:hypothetical protein